MKRTQHGKTKCKIETVKAGGISVKIYGRERIKNGVVYPQFDVADYTTGTRRFRSFADHAEARREAETIARRLATGDATAAAMTGRDSASLARARQLLEGTGLSIEVAAAHFAQAVKELGGDRVVEAARYFASRSPDKLPSKTVAEVVAEVLELRAARGASARYLGDLRSKLNRFADAFAVQIASVTTSDLQRYLDGMSLSPVTLAGYRKALSVLFSFAQSRGYIPKGENPVEGTERVSTNGFGRTIEIYTPGEVAKLLAAASPDFLPFLAIGAFAGLRAAEIQRLDWRNVDLAAGFITVGADIAKTASRRIVPISDNLRAWLAPHAKQSGPVWQGDDNTLAAARTETAQAAGVPWKPNALRHSFCSYRLAAVQSAPQVALEAGNSPQIIFRHYRELVRPADAAAWFAVAPQAPANVLPIAAQA
jgi:integrase